MDKKHKIEAVEAKLDRKIYRYVIPGKRHLMFMLSTSCTALMGIASCLAFMEHHHIQMGNTSMLFFVLIILPPIYTATKYLSE